jgi:hypothetical protein
MEFNNLTALICVFFAISFYRKMQKQFSLAIGYGENGRERKLNVICI